MAAQSDILHLCNPNRTNACWHCSNGNKTSKKTSGMDVGQILAMCIFVNCDFRKTNGVRDPNKHPEKKHETTNLRCVGSNRMMFWGIHWRIHSDDLKVKWACNCDLDNGELSRLS